MIVNQGVSKEPFQSYLLLLLYLLQFLLLFLYLLFLFLLIFLSVSRASKGCKGIKTPAPPSQKKSFSVSNFQCEQKLNISSDAILSGGLDDRKSSCKRLEEDEEKEE